MKRPPPWKGNTQGVEGTTTRRWNYFLCKDRVAIVRVVWHVVENDQT